MTEQTAANFQNKTKATPPKVSMCVKFIHALCLTDSLLACLVQNLCKQMFYSVMLTKMTVQITVSCNQIILFPGCI